jgi:hypothetical protein
VRQGDDLQPGLVGCELFEGRLRWAGVLIVVDSVLDAGSPAVTTFDHSDVQVVLIGEERANAAPTPRAGPSSR